MLATTLLMSPILYFLRDVWIQSQRAAVASRRATNLATHVPQLSHPSPWAGNLATSGLWAEASECQKHDPESGHIRRPLNRSMYRKSNHIRSRLWSRACSGNLAHYRCPLSRSMCRKSSHFRGPLSRKSSHKKGWPRRNMYRKSGHIRNPQSGACSEDLAILEAFGKNRVRKYTVVTSWACDVCIQHELFKHQYKTRSRYEGCRLGLVCTVVPVTYSELLTLKAK